MKLFGATFHREIIADRIAQDQVKHPSKQVSMLYKITAVQVRKVQSRMQRRSEGDLNSSHILQTFAVCLVRTEEHCWMERRSLTWPGISWGSLLSLAVLAVVAAPAMVPALSL